MEKDKKQKSKSSKIINIISNCVFVPVMIILVVYFIYALSVINKNGIPSFFGQSYAKVMSNSMSPDIKKGDIVILEKCKISDIKEGDVIAFYASSNRITNENGSKDTAKDYKTGEKTYQATIYFHKVYDIKYDSYGDTWFYTYGINNLKPGGDPNSEDIEENFNVDNETRGDYVIGRYKKSGLAGFIAFISSPTGMIILVIVPSAILLFTLLLNIIEIIDQMMKEKKQRVEFADDEVKERELDVTTIIEETDDSDETP